MSIMRALKNVGIGYLQGTTDIMAQKAAQKREDEKLAADREFEFKLQHLTCQVFYKKTITCQKIL
jgi:hypothetical protein